MTCVYVPTMCVVKLLLFCCCGLLLLIDFLLVSGWREGQGKAEDREEERKMRRWNRWNR